MEWLLVAIAVVVLGVPVVRYVVGRMVRAAQKYRDAVAWEEIESVKRWLERQRQQPHG